MHESEATMHEQSSGLAAGGRGEALASQTPLARAGHACGVLDGVYEAELVAEGLIDAI